MSELILPKGVVSLTGAGNPIDPGLLTNRPDIDGITVGQAWSDYETADGTYDRSYFTSELQKVVNSGKFAAFGVGTGGGRASLGGSKPDWLMDLVGANTFEFIRDASSVIIPWFWETTYLAKKLAMIADLGQNFGNNPAIKVVHCNFANANTEDWAVPYRNVVDGVNPPGSSEESRWITAGWTIPLMLDAAQQIIDAYATAFPNAHIYIALGEIKSPVLDPAGTWNLATTVLANARLRWGTRILPGRNSLTTFNAPTALQTSNPPFACQALWRCFQDPAFRMLGGSNPDGLTDDEVLRLAFDKVKDAAFFEIYLPDALNLLGAVAYGHNLLNPDAEPAPGPEIKVTEEITGLRFRDVIWGVAYKMGWMSPELSDEQFDELVSFCNAWVRRFWDSQDLPDLTKILKVDPDSSHYVVNPGRTLRLYLVDPEVTPAPCDAPFTLLSGKVHCGFEHGASVWLKYLPLPAVFTSEKWDTDATYKKNKIIYSPVTGECYKNLIDNNHGHDPSEDAVNIQDISGSFPLTVEVTQRFNPGIDDVPPTDEVWRIQVDDPPLYDLDGTRYRVIMRDTDGVQHSVIYVTPAPGGTIDDVLDGLEAAFAASSDPFVTSLTFAQEAPNKFTLTLSSARFSAQADVTESGGTALPLLLEHLSSYDPGRTGRAEVPQIAEITLDPDLDLLSAMYSIAARDSADQRHVVNYESPDDEALEQTLAGIVAAINAAATGDPWWGGVVVATDPATNVLTFTNGESVRYQATAEVSPDATPAEIWERIVFPQVLAEPVMDGMYQDALREEGQTDKALAEAPTTTADLNVAVSKTVNQPYDRLTDQQVSRSRYRM